MPRSPVQIVVIDTETTGLDPARDRVIDIGAVRLGADLQVAATWSTLVDPECALPLQITRLTGIAAADLAGAPTFARAYVELREFVGEALVVGQNVAFDLAMLGAAAARCGAPPLRVPSFDTLAASLLLFPEIDRHGLAAMAVTLGLGEPPHRALPDAEVTAALLDALRRRAATLTADERRLFEAADWAPLTLLDGLPPLAASPAPPSRTDGERRPAQTTPIPADARPAALACDAADWQVALGEGGALSTALDGFVVRPGQVEMAAAVAGMLASGGLGLFEAGTGMGKSLAYLLPAAFRAAACGERVTISTKTKALQRQLAERELPLVASCLPQGFRWTLLMGRENYLCRRRLDEAIAAAGDGLPERDRLLALAWLLGRVRRGEVDVSALPYGATQTLPALAETARELRASAASCLAGRCGSRGACLWRRARTEARAAHLVCVNHALLLTGGDTLPPFDDLVVDEAHLLPDEAVSAFSEQRRQGTRRRTPRRGSRPPRTPPAGRRRRLAAGKVASDAAAALGSAADGFEHAARVMPSLADGLGAAIEALATAIDEPDADTTTTELYGRTLLLTPGLQEQPLFDTFARRLRRARRGSGRTRPGGLGDRRSAPRGTPRAPPRRRSGRRRRGRGPPAHRRDQAAPGQPRVLGRAAGRHGLGPAGPGLAAGRAWSLNCAPLSPAPIVRERLWDRLRSGVLVSATLGVAGSFAYYRGEAGLGHRSRRERARLSPHPSTFAVRRRSCSSTTPTTRYRADEQPARLAARLRRLTELTGGRLLALFTNRREVEAVATLIGAHIEDEGVVLLAQGVHGSAAALAKEFRSHPATVLLGVDALWTGQDFPGDALVCLVIARLPFPRAGRPLRGAPSDRRRRRPRLVSRVLPARGGAQVPPGVRPPDPHRNRRRGRGGARPPAHAEVLPARVSGKPA